MASFELGYDEALHGLWVSEREGESGVESEVDLIVVGSDRSWQLQAILGRRWFFNSGDDILQRRRNERSCWLAVQRLRLFLLSCRWWSNNCWIRLISCLISCLISGQRSWNVGTHLWYYLLRSTWIGDYVSLCTFSWVWLYNWFFAFREVQRRRRNIRSNLFPSLQNNGKHLWLTVPEWFASSTYVRVSNLTEAKSVHLVFICVACCSRHWALNNAFICCSCFLYFFFRWNNSFCFVVLCIEYAWKT